MTVIGECVALYDYTADADNHISLKAGDRIEIHQKEASGWWSGVLLGSQMFGWFPASYVEEVQSGLAKSSPIHSNITSNNSTESPWEEHFTEEGEVYYVNTVTGESAWTIPSQTTSTAGRTSDGWDTPSPTLQQSASVNTYDSGIQDVLTERFASMPSPSALDDYHSRQHRQSNAHSILSMKSTGKNSNHSGASPSMPPLTFTDPAPQPCAEGGRYGYAENFWSDKGDKSGFDILVLKHRNGKEVCKDIAHFMQERARIEEHYAKAIMDLAKSQLGDLESGTAKTAWNQVKFDLLTQAQSRMLFAKKLSKDVRAPILQFKNDQKKMRKNYEATIAADRKAMALKYLNVQKAQKNYIQRSKELEIADALVVRGQTSTMTKKDFMKVEENARKEKKKASVAAYDYKLAVEDFEKTRQQWEDDMVSASLEFQQAEEERLEYLKSTLQEYLKVQIEVNSECKESSEMVENSIDAVCKEIDIEMFVKEHFTGNFRPNPVKFEPYNFISPFQ